MRSTTDRAKRLLALCREFDKGVLRFPSSSIGSTGVVRGALFFLIATKLQFRIPLDEKAILMQDCASQSGILYAQAVQRLASVAPAEIPRAPAQYIALELW